MQVTNLMMILMMILSDQSAVSLYHVLSAQLVWNLNQGNTKKYVVQELSTTFDQKKSEKNQIKQFHAVATQISTDLLFPMGSMW